jgi:DNA invertase Pin-like site-specific DNA recombinase
MKKGGLLLGYARVSKADDQDNAAQVKALRLAGCKRVFEEKASGGRWDRPQLHNALEQLREGDVLVVWKLDRLSRSLKDLLQIMEKVSDAGAGFRSITEAVDTTTSAGRMLMQMLGSFAEFERSMVRERTRAGLAAARDRGARLGRPAKLSAHQQQEVIKAVRDGSKTAADAARLFGLHRSNITRLLERSEMNADRNQPNRSSMVGG